MLVTLGARGAKKELSVSWCLNHFNVMTYS